MADPSWWQRPLDLPARYRGLPFEVLEGPEEAAVMLAERAALVAGPVSVLEEVGDLQPPSPAQVLLNISAGRSGELVALWCDAADEHHAVPAADSMGRNESEFRPPRPLAMTITVDIPDGVRTTQVQVPQVWLTYPIVEATPDGSFLIVSDVCALEPEGPDLNAIVVDASGAITKQITLGDGVLDVQTTPDGKTWIGYSDTGILGNHGWDSAGSDDETAQSQRPIGSFGLVRFDDTYSIEWEFGCDQYQAGSPNREIIDHVYGLTVLDETAWVYYRSAYSIARVVNDEVRAWDTDVENARALLISDTRLALVGGYGPAYDRIVIGHLDETSFVRDSTGRIVLPNGSDLPLNTRSTSRGAIRHVVAGNRWYRLVL